MDLEGWTPLLLLLVWLQLLVNWELENLEVLPVETDYDHVGL